MDNILKIIADNPALAQELRKILEKQFEPPTDYREMGAALDDQVLGQYLRARITGMKAIDNAFIEIDKHKTLQGGGGRSNPAR